MQSPRTLSLINCPFPQPTRGQQSLMPETLSSQILQRACLHGKGKGRPQRSFSGLSSPGSGTSVRLGKGGEHRGGGTPELPAVRVPSSPPWGRARIKSERRPGREGVGKEGMFHWLQVLRDFLPWDFPHWKGKGSCQLRSQFLFKFANPDMHSLGLAPGHEPQNHVPGAEGSVSGRFSFRAFWAR